MLAFPGLCIYVSVHRNARMTEEIRRIFEVLLAFAITSESFQRDNIGISLELFSVLYICKAVSKAIYSFPQSWLAL